MGSWRAWYASARTSARSPRASNCPPRPRPVRTRGRNPPYSPVFDPKFEGSVEVGPLRRGAALGAAVAEGPRPTPRRRFGSGQRRRLGAGGPQAGGVPVGRGLVGQGG